jgi:hypothetical protein
MQFRLIDAFPLLERTPAVLQALLADVPAAWAEATEGPGTWSPFDIVGHLVHGERTDWIPRATHLLQHGEAVPFAAFDREGMRATSRGRTLAQLLDEFATARAASLAHLRELRLDEADLSRTGTHPELGRVTLREHLATWVAHDLSHLGQIARVLGRQYTEAVGPWRAYLPMLGRSD